MAELALVSDADPLQRPVVPPAISTWLVGFHGALQASDIGGDSVSLRSVALSHRSLGTQRLSVLTDLPSLRDPRGVPHSQRGFRPVGAWSEVEEAASLLEQSGSAADTAAAVDVRQGEPDATAAVQAPVVLWEEPQSLMEYLDRRLLEARVLYLPNRGRLYHLVKRLMDIAGALVLLTLTAPLLLVLTVMIRVDSPGPAVFRHQRVTIGGRLFTFYKFRTMWVDARERYPELYDYQRTGRLGEVYYKLEDDPRNTRVGRWLRRTTLDELPNLFNVLKGDMTLVGPRPELPQLVAHYYPEDLALFFTKAGVTGLAQIAGRSLLTVRERIALDLRYVAQQTLLLDLRILVRTVSVVVLGRGAF